MIVYKNIGTDESIEISRFFSLLRQRSDAIARIDREDEALGTGFLIADDVLLTNNHVFSRGKEVLAKKEDAMDVTALFNFQLDENGALLPTSRYEFRPDAYWKASVELDCVAVGIEPDAGRAWGAITLEAPSKPVRPGDTVTIIGHPDGQTKRIASDGNIVTRVEDSAIEYMTDTSDGSSGSPVFNWKLEVVAMHHAEKRRIDQAGRPRFTNEGVNINAVRRLL